MLPNLSSPFRIVGDPSATRKKNQWFSKRSSRSLLGRSLYFTSAPMGTLKVKLNAILGNYDRPTDQQTDQQTDQWTNGLTNRQTES